MPCRPRTRRSDPRRRRPAVGQSGACRLRVVLHPPGHWNFRPGPARHDAGSAAPVLDSRASPRLEIPALILPIAVTGIVMIVQNSVALAFSLAGIVAAVRFRTTLEDTKDAVYVFLAIGVGLACGVQALGIAITLSVVFNVVILALWRTQFGNIYADQNTRAGPLGIGDVLAGPGSARAALRVGDPAVLEAASVTDLADIADRAVRIERHLSEERAKKKDRRANSLFVIHTANAQSVQAFVEPILEDMSVRWQLAEMGEGPSGTMMIYVARLDGEGAQGAVMDRLRESEHIEAAELRALKGLKPRK